MTVELQRRLFTVDEYHKLGEAGVLTEGDRVELMDGEIVKMSPIGRRHAACVDRLTSVFTSRLGGSAIVRVQNPIALSEQSEPQPDIAVLRPRDDFYAYGHPGPADILLVIEVAETSIEFDREVKIPRCAMAGIVEAWLVDLGLGEVQIRRNPTASGYTDLQTISSGEIPAPVSFPTLQLTVEDIIGQRATHE